MRPGRAGAARKDAASGAARPRRERVSFASLPADRPPPPARLPSLFYLNCRGFNDIHEEDEGTGTGNLLQLTDSSLWEYFVLHCNLLVKRLQNSPRTAALCSRLYASLKALNLGELGKVIECVYIENWRVR